MSTPVKLSLGFEGLDKVDENKLLYNIGLHTFSKEREVNFCYFAVKSKDCS